MGGSAQVRAISSGLWLILAITVVFLGAVVFGRLVGGIRIDHLTRDPASLTHSSVYLGFLSTVGLLFWAAAAAVCILGASLVSGSRLQSRLVRFLRASAFLTLVLLLDDAFLVHERVLPRYAGVPQRLVYLVYVLLLVVYLVRFRAVIFETDYFLLGLALILFGFSIVSDLIWDSPLEDGTKFAGIVTWTVYFGRVVTSTCRLPPDSGAARGPVPAT